MTEPRYHFEISPPTSPERMAIEMGRQISHGNEEEEEVKEDPPTPRRLSMMRRAMSAPQGISDSLDSQLSDFESEFAVEYSILYLPCCWPVGACGGCEGCC